MEEKDEIKNYQFDIKELICKLRYKFNVMKQRCYNPNTKDYKYYGARNIKICDEWLQSKESFIKWSLEHGFNKKNNSIDRIDSRKDYCPENCRYIPFLKNVNRPGCRSPKQSYDGFTSIYQMGKVLGYEKERSADFRKKVKLLKRHNIPITLENVRLGVRGYKKNLTIKK